MVSAARQREHTFGKRVRLGEKVCTTSKVGARFQASFQRKAWILEGIGENQMVFKGNDAGTDKLERA